MELFPCPFCGAAPVISNRFGTAISCSNDQCIIYTDRPIPYNDFGHKYSAIAAWNRRALRHVPREEGVRLAGVADMEALLAPAPSVPQGWIACSERLPGEGDVLVSWDTGGVEQMHHASVEAYTHRKVNGGGIVTHWMPLPAAPKGAEHE